MAKLTDRTELTTPADGDLYVTTDVSDTTDAATGTDKKITWANIKAGLKTYFDTLYAAALGADDNYVTDAEKIKLSNLSGTNTGDQDLSSYLTSATAASTYLTTATAASTYEPLKGSDDNYVTDAEKAALHSHSNKAVLDATTASFTTADETKLDGIEAGADVTDATNVTAAGALMDSELTDIVAVKALADAAASDVNTGTSTTMFVTPDALAGSYAGTKSLSVQVFDGTTDVTTGDGKAYITIPEALNGMNLIRAQATVVTAGTTNATTVMIHNKTDANDMLSAAASIASGGTVGTAGTVNTSFDDVATNDVLRIDVDSVSTTAPKGLMVVLEFRLA